MSLHEPRDLRTSEAGNNGIARAPGGLKGSIPRTHSFSTADGQGKSIQTYQKGQPLFFQGEDADEIFYIQRGRVKVSTASAHGKDAVVGILEKGQFVGETCLTGAPLRLTTATAIETSLLTIISGSAMREALQKEHGFAQSFVTYLLERNSRIEDDLIDQLLNSSEKRLARLLLILANYGREGAPPIIAVPLRQETLA